MILTDCAGCGGDGLVNDRQGRTVLCSKCGGWGAQKLRCDRHRDRPAEVQCLGYWCAECASNLDEILAQKRAEQREVLRRLAEESGNE